MKSAPLRHWRELLAQPGSIIRPCYRTCTCRHCKYWRELESHSCNHCGLKLSESYSHWLQLWSNGAVAHLSCVEDSIELERIQVNRPTIIEAAARSAQLTIEGFQGMNSWDREKLCRQQLDAENPNWFEAITEELRRRRSLPTTTNK